MLDLLLESFAERLGGWTGRLDRWARARGAPQHRSLESQTHIALQFENCTEHTVRVAWLDFQGLPVSYAILLPGSTTLQHSFATHAWTFEALSPPGWFMRSRATLPVLVCADTLAMVVYGEPAPAPKRVRICAASQRTWSPAAHAAHFDAYSKSVRTVLLIHASRRGRLSPAPPFSAAPDFELVTLLCAAARAHRGDAHILDEDRAHRSLADLPKVRPF